jgi:hypothetical protein
MLGSTRPNGDLLVEQPVVVAPEERRIRSARVAMPAGTVSGLEITNSGRNRPLG